MLRGDAVSASCYPATKLFLAFHIILVLVWSKRKSFFWLFFCGTPCDRTLVVMISWSFGNRFPVQSLQSQRSLAMHCLEAAAEIPSSARQDVPMHLGAGRRRNLDLAHSVPMCMFWWSIRPTIHGGSWWILGLCWFGSLPAEDIELGQSETCLETNMESFQIHGINLSESAVFWRQWSWLGPHIFWNQVASSGMANTSCFLGLAEDA